MSSERKKKEVSFEEALVSLEKVLVALEEGEVPLAVLVEKFEEGTRNLRICQKHLQEAELKIEQLKSNESLVPFQEMGSDPNE